jgi:hypothetical protein
MTIALPGGTILVFRDGCHAPIRSAVGRVKEVLVPNRIGTADC